MNDRYSRQELFHPIGKQGQAKIREKSVLIVGAGALGASSAEALTRAGVKRLVLVDRDYVDWTNLQRQQLYSEEDARDQLPKVIAAKNRLEMINRDVEIQTHVMDMGIEEAEELISGIDLVMDATDNFETRLMINDLAQKHQVPWIYGACVGSYGISYTILPGEGPCLNCLLDKIPANGQTCDTVGIIAPAVQMVVAYQTAEALKILVEDYQAVRKKIVTFDLWENQHMQLGMEKAKKEDCPSCGANPTYPYLKRATELKTAVLCGRDTVQIRPPNNREIDLEEMERRLGSQGKIRRNPYLLEVESDSRRFVLFKDGRALVHGTKNTAEAKSIYHRFIG
ncbi:MoeB/ThiF family adenylyltransferase [Fictibacillus phosphorivorans]|uniref:MoeB/ThiF family adenylyltransferase n=1 Tax=Fictibacillus phosphorivorans TaxID=1221500 RepID=UPI00203D0B60|nr:MoeB/ThiF family adenylyltransferase [Fictibacillus phosphorivorans]MCM3775953.1 MoeB/ThiF family adenylyltransferase [Fictibacillus phosphorivorans]